MSASEQTARTKVLDLAVELAIQTNATLVELVREPYQSMPNAVRDSIDAALAAVDHLAACGAQPHHRTMIDRASAVRTLRNSGHPRGETAAAALEQATHNLRILHSLYGPQAG